jgi:hypothetical protein
MWATDTSEMMDCQAGRVDRLARLGARRPLGNVPLQQTTIDASLGGGHKRRRSPQPELQQTSSQAVWRAHNGITPFGPPPDGV